MFGPEIMGKLVKLAPMDESMADTFYSYINDPEPNRFRPAPPVESVETESEWIRSIGKSEQDIVWAIYCLEDCKLVGSTGLHRYERDHKRAASGTLIGKPAYWGRGIGSEVVRLRTDYAFEELDLHKLNSEVIHGNSASLRMLMRVGYRIVGLFRDHFLRHDEWLDFYFLECMHADWELARPRSS
jgi:RimJ/RimL family protein N-acetyltransferase